jgi:hypothetical protein
MEIECLNTIKKPFKISLIVEVALSEPFFMAVMSVATYSPLPVAAETAIVPHVNRINRIGG